MIRFFFTPRKQISFENILYLALVALIIWLIILMPFMFGIQGHIQKFALFVAICIAGLVIFRFVRQYDSKGYWVAIIAGILSAPIYLLFRSMIFDAEAIFILVVIAISAQWGVGPGLFLASSTWIAYGLITLQYPNHPDPTAQILMNGGFLIASAIIVGTLAQRRQSALLSRAKMIGVLETSYAGFLKSMSLTLDARDTYTQGHSKRVAQLAEGIAKEMKLPAEEIEQICQGALLHDIGKIGIRDEILHKPGKLNADEWALMRRHPEIGYEMLHSIPFLSSALDAVLYHHERFDGTGYPAGLKGNDIPLPARILAVADAYDAMTSSRPYRPGLSKIEALNEIRKFAGSQFDPTVINIFERTLPSFVTFGIVFTENSDVV